MPVMIALVKVLVVLTVVVMFRKMQISLGTQDFINFDDEKAPTITQTRHQFILLSSHKGI